MDKHYLITGYNTGASGSAYLSYAQVIASTGAAAILIPRNQISFAIPANPWIKGKQFDSYTESNNEGSYCNYNDKVYLCLSNNSNNVKNITNSSNYAPTHTTGTITKLDGYDWMHLYNITSTVATLSNTNFIPAPSTYGLKLLINNQESDIITCPVGNTGTCAQYLSLTGGTLASLIYTNGPTGGSCDHCVQIAEETTKTDGLWTIFYEPGVIVPSTISLFNYTESLERAIANGKINAKLNFEANTYMGAIASGISAGALLSANINIAAISAAEVADGVSAGIYFRVSSAENSMIILNGTGGTGSGATAQFITVAGTTYSTIIGVRLVSGGGNYTPELVTVSLPGISSSSKRAALEDNIGFVGTPPSLIFTKINTIFDTASQNSIGEDRVVNIINAKPDAFTTANYYGIVKADPGKTELIDIVPAKLQIFPLTSNGPTLGKEIKNINFIQSINNTEKQRR